MNKYNITTGFWQANLCAMYDEVYTGEGAKLVELKDSVSVDTIHASDEGSEQKNNLLSCSQTVLYIHNIAL